MELLYKIFFFPYFLIASITFIINNWHLKNINREEISNKYRLFILETLHYRYFISVTIWAAIILTFI